jgi:hypothetical protein
MVFSTYGIKKACGGRPGALEALGDEKKQTEGTLEV